MATASTERGEFARVSAGGVVAGLISGVFLSLVLLASLTFHGQSSWVAFKGASAPFFHERAMQPGFDAGPVVVGFIAHFVISAGWGFGFAVVCYGLSRGATMVAGALWGIVVWLGMYYVLLPLIGLGEIAQHVPVGQAILEHVMFGVVLAAAFLPFQRRVPTRWRGFKRAA
jgi:uncharacterized protein DUF6789